MPLCYASLPYVYDTLCQAAGLVAASIRVASITPMNALITSRGSLLVPRIVRNANRRTFPLIFLAEHETNACQSLFI